MDALDSLQSRIDGLAGSGNTAPWGAEGRLTIACSGLSAAAQTLRGLFQSTTNVVLLKELRCGQETGLALVVGEGNYKDGACLVAASAVAEAFADELAAPLLAEVDLPPAVRRAMLRAYDGVVALSGLSVAPNRFGSVGRPRTTLNGIGASAAAAILLPRRAWLTAIGECPTWLLRDGCARRLSLPDTLANAPGYRAAAEQDPARALDGAESILTKVLGNTPDEPPSFNVTRLDLEPGDRIVLGNEWLTPYVENVAPAARARTAAELCDELAAAVEAEPSPIPVTVAVGATD